jgi:alanyl-tRNA synthetase
MTAETFRKPIPGAPSGNEIRRAYLDFFAERGHTIVPSASLVPGDDPTLLFTNAGMVQFKDVFLGIGSRPYSRAVDSQKCMRVAGKHNDLDDVGRDDSHHTFFEMLGNWSFGDYYKKETIAWAWELLTEVWGLPKDRLWATCFEDERGQIPRDDEAAEIWKQQPGFDPSHILFFGREENFWEMAETGPCGPDSEIHLDLGPEFCDMQDVEGHVCQVNQDCSRFLELWNLVFIQYNKTGPGDLTPLPHKHVDTGLGLERIVSVLQGVYSNYQTDLFTPMMDRIQELAGHTDREREALLTPYRVISDHARAASFLIADGVVPGNTGRNYVCRMIIRRASRFGTEAGFNAPFMSEIAAVVIRQYGEAYPELQRNRAAILETITEEERRFRHTVESGLTHLESSIARVEVGGGDVISGERAFELYATYGLPLEITRDIAREHGLEVDQAAFFAAMEEHRLASGGPHAFEAQSGPEIDLYRDIQEDLERSGKLPDGQVQGDPYSGLERETQVLALTRDGAKVADASPGDTVGIVLRETPFYVEAGGQVSDKGTLVSVAEPRWEIEVQDAREPIAGLIVHLGEVKRGQPSVGDPALVAVYRDRRWDIMRNHTATHLLHAALREVLGEHARQAGSLVAPDRLRFDFTHAHALTHEELAAIERKVNDAILANYPLHIQHKSRQAAIEGGAMALFGETYGETVRTIRIGENKPISYELCGGTHVPETGVIGPFKILSEGSVAAGIRRIEAVTGRAALELIQRRLSAMERISRQLGTSPEDLEERFEAIEQHRHELESEVSLLRRELAGLHYERLEPQLVEGVPVLTGIIPEISMDELRQLVDRFRSQQPQGVVVLGSASDGRPGLVAGVSEDLVQRGLHAGRLVQHVAEVIEGGGGGRPTLAQAGGKDSTRLQEALTRVIPWVRANLTPGT